jgi:FdhD protein
VTLDLRTTRRPIVRVTAAGAERVDDTIAVEGALEIRIDDRPLAVTLRTPGNDRELALGFLAAEDVIHRGADVTATRERLAACAGEPDAIEVTLAAGVTLDWSRLERHFTATAACGLCGRAHLDALRAGLTPMPRGQALDPAALVALPGRVHKAQVGFSATGGLHAAAYCDGAFDVQVVREDVGRHNAVDKVCGFLLETGSYPANQGVLWVSGRAGAEIVLKAARARIPVLAAVGAPSSLAIELAEAARMTLIGFLRDGRMNVYSGDDRLALDSRTGPA